MPINGLAPNQLVSSIAASGADFVLKLNQVHENTLKCMTKLEAMTKYHLVPSNLSTYTDNQLPPNEAWVKRPVAWRGVNPSCLIEDPTTLNAFNFMVIKYMWSAGAGDDLDTFTGIVNSGTILDNNWLGYQQGNISVPDATSINTAYCYWAGDDQNPVAGFESVLINFNKITTDFPTLTTVVTKMAAVWWDPFLSGNIDVEIKTYLGGTMSQSGFNIINTGGSNVQSLTFSKKIGVRSQTALITNAIPVGFIIYNKSSTTGKITITY